MKGLSIIFDFDGSIGFSPMLIVTGDGDALIVSCNWQAATSSGVDAEMQIRISSASGYLTSIRYATASGHGGRLKLIFSRTAPRIALLSIDGLAHYVSHSFSSN